MENRFDIKPGERVIFLAWGSEAASAHALACGGEVLFCDIDLTCGDADLEHLKELCATGARKAFLFCDGAAAQLARALGVEVIIMPGKEAAAASVAGAKPLEWRGFEDILRIEAGRSRDRVAEELEAAGFSCEKTCPVYDDAAFRFAAPPDGQYPYYMLYLSGAENLSRECVRVVRK